MTTTVSIRELKDQLSSYVRKIRAGEEIVLTSRRKPVVRMLPVNDPSCDGLPRLPLIKWSSKKPRGGSQRPRVDETSASEMVLEDRR